MPEVPVMVSVVAAGAFGLSSHMIFIAVSSYTIVSYGSYAASGECLERERRSFDLLDSQSSSHLITSQQPSLDRVLPESY